MSARPSESDVDELSRAVWREFAAAHARVDEVVARRRALERELEAVAAAERECRRALAALTAVIGDAADGADEMSDNATGTAHALAGGALREASTRVALRRNAHGEACVGGGGSAGCATRVSMPPGSGPGPVSDAARAQPTGAAIRP